MTVTTCTPWPASAFEVAGERGHQRLAFAGLHFGDLALVQHHAADQLHVEVAHLHRAPARLADHREGLGQNLVQRRAFGRLDFVGVGDAFEPGGNARAELSRLGAQLFVRELFHLRLHRADGATMGSNRLMARSLAVPNTFVSALSKTT